LRIAAEIHAAAPTFPSLTHLTLTEYVPAKWARLLLSTVDSLKELDLALLAPPIRKTINTRRDLPRHAYLFGDSRLSVWPPVPATIDDEDEDEDDIILSEDDVIAMSPLTLSLRDLTCLASLRRLRLCKPAERIDEGEMNHVMHNLHREKAALEEWAEMLRASREALEEVVFDLRPVVPETWLEGIMEDEPVSKRVREPGDMRFSEVVLGKVFFRIEEGGRKGWYRLRKVRFCGVEIEDSFADSPTGGGRKKLAERFGPEIKVEYTPGLYCFVIEGEERTGRGILL
jgi:hypothetical protein